MTSTPTERRPMSGYPLLPAPEGARRTAPPAEPPAEDAPLTRVWPAARFGLTAVLVCGMFLCLLFLLQLGGLGAAEALALAAVIAVVNRQALPGLIGARSFIFIIPAFAMLSALWSEDSFVSFRASLELLATVAAGMVLALVDRRLEVVVGLVAAFALYTLDALTQGHFVAEGTEAAVFTGLNDGKNYLAEITFTGVMITAGLLVVAVEERKPVWLPIAAAASIAGLLEIYVGLLAHSAGAVIALCVGLSALVGLFAVSRLSIAWRSAAVATVGVVMGALALFHDAVVRELSSEALKVFDKDPTLTGRTYLWYRAHQMIAEKPLLGHGYAAFWRQGNPDAEGLWRFGNITNRYGFNFHNTGVELLMQFGWCGAVVVAAVFLVGAALLVRRFVLKPDAVTCMWLALVAFETIRTFYESIGPTPFYFSNVLLAAAFAYALRTPVLVSQSKP